MNARTKMFLVAGALAVFAGGGGDGCDCGGCDDCGAADNWTDELDKDMNMSRSSSSPLPGRASSGAHALPTMRPKWAEVERGAELQVVNTQVVEKGKWPKWYVQNTNGANMSATWDCNGWERNTNPIVSPGQIIKICGWR